MAEEFSLLGFASFLTGMAVEMHTAEHHALEKAAVIVETEAKAEIGHYQGAAGPFGAWPALKPSTIEQKTNGDTPLLETGAMRDSIGHVVGDGEASVGSNEDTALWQELGTSRGIPPRSFLGGAAARKAPEVAETIGREMHSFLVGGGKSTPIR